MKKILFRLMLICSCLLMPTSCFWFGSCANWNCTELNKWWKKAVDDCYSRNFDVGVLELGYKSRLDVQRSKIGDHISYQCIRNSGRYYIKKDKEYSHLFANRVCANGKCPTYDPRKLDEINKCHHKNFNIVLATKKLGYKTPSNVSYSEFGPRISSQCIYNAGKYDIREDKEYRHLFTD